MFNPLDCAAPHNGITCELLIILLSYRSMVRYVKVLRSATAPPIASWSIVQFSRFKLIIWPAESNSKQCDHESGWNWWNHHIRYANHRWTCMQMHWCVCVKSAGAYCPLWTLCQETKPELTLATKVISKCRKIITIADRQCAVWYVTLLNALSWSMWPETGKEQKKHNIHAKDSSLEKLMAVLWG